MDPDDYWENADTTERRVALSDALRSRAATTLPPRTTPFTLDAIAFLNTTVFFYELYELLYNGRTLGTTRFDALAHIEAGATTYTLNWSAKYATADGAGDDDSASDEFYAVDVNEYTTSIVCTQLAAFEHAALAPCHAWSNAVTAAEKTLRSRGGADAKWSVLLTALATDAAFAFEFARCLSIIEGITFTAHPSAVDGRRIVFDIDTSNVK